jgi:hypothetical protein
MALPKLARPEYSTTIPSTGKKIKYQPFSVREEKVLVLAAESEDMDEIGNAIANVLRNCVSSPADFDPQELALFDVEYLFLKARSKSIGEKITLNVTDPSDPSFTVEHQVNVDSVKVDKNPDHTDTIQVTDEVVIKMKYPGLSFFAEGLKIANISESTETVAKCVGSIVIGDEVYSAADMTTEEVLEWLDGLTTEQYGKIMEFFTTMPKLSHTIKRKNTNTGKQFEVVLEGLADFF